MRVALGATPRDVLRLVTGQSVRVLTVGMAVGICASFALAQEARAAAGDGRGLDPGWPAYVAPMLIVAMVGVAATWIPSRRAVRTNPATVLRSAKGD